MTAKKPKYKFIGTPNVAVKYFRTHCGMTMEQLGRTLGVSRQYIWRLENGGSDGYRDLWKAFQHHFELSDSEAWQVYQGILPDRFKTNLD